LQLQNTIADQEAQIEGLKQQLAAKDDQVST
jgi:cell division septum initiation protein DivIVA